MVIDLYNHYNVIYNKQISIRLSQSIQVDECEKLVVKDNNYCRKTKAT